MSVHIEKVMGPLTRSAEELERLRRLEFEIPPRGSGRMNRLLKCCGDNWHWMRRGGVQTFRMVTVNGSWLRDDDPRPKLDAFTRLNTDSGFAKLEGERFVGSISHALETFRSIGDRAALPLSSDMRLSETDGALLARACALVCHDQRARRVRRRTEGERTARREERFEGLRRSSDGPFSRRKEGRRASGPKRERPTAQPPVTRRDAARASGARGRRQRPSRTSTGTSSRSWN